MLGLAFPFAHKVPVVATPTKPAGRLRYYNTPIDARNDYIWEVEVIAADGDHSWVRACRMWSPSLQRWVLPAGARLSDLYHLTVRSADLREYAFEE